MGGISLDFHYMCTTIGIFTLISHLTVCQPEKNNKWEPLSEIGHENRLSTVHQFPKVANFFEGYVSSNRPLLMRQAVSNQPAFHRWSNKYLALVSPSNSPEVFVRVLQGRKEVPPHENTSTSTRRFQNFRKFVESFRSVDSYLVDSVPGFLLGDLTLPSCLNCPALFPALEDAVLWFSGGETKSLLHVDAYENLNCVYRGHKRVLLVNTSRYDDEVRRAVLDGGVYSRVDVDSVNLERYPQLDKMEFFTEELEPGDCVYIPAGWMHQVTSFGGVNMAITLLWHPGKHAPLCSEAESEPERILNMINFQREYKTSENLEYAGQFVNWVLQRLRRDHPKEFQFTMDQFLEAILNPDFDTAEGAASKELDDLLMRVFHLMDEDESLSINAEEIARVLTDSPGKVPRLAGLHHMWNEIISEKQLNGLLIRFTFRESEMKEKTEKTVGDRDEL